MEYFEQVMNVKDGREAIINEVGDVDACVG